MWKDQVSHSCTGMVITVVMRGDSSLNSVRCHPPQWWGLWHWFCLWFWWEVKFLHRRSRKVEICQRNENSQNEKKKKKKEKKTIPYHLGGDWTVHHHYYLLFSSSHPSFCNAPDNDSDSLRRTSSSWMIMMLTSGQWSHVHFIWLSLISFGEKLSWK